MPLWLQGIHTQDQATVFLDDCIQLPPYYFARCSQYRQVLAILLANIPLINFKALLIHFPLYFHQLSLFMFVPPADIRQHIYPICAGWQAQYQDLTRRVACPSM